MKQILVYRHAKAQKGSDNLADFVRQLTSDGVRQAASVGKTLRSKDLVPQRIFSSDAVRAMQTAEVTAEYCEYSGEIDDVPELYQADAEDYLKLMAGLPEGVSRVLLVGHNPAVEEIVERLLKRHVDMKTGTVAWIESLAEAWNDVATSELTLRGTISA